MIESKNKPTPDRKCQCGKSIPDCFRMYLQCAADTMPPIEKGDDDGE